MKFFAFILLLLSISSYGAAQTMNKGERIDPPLEKNSVDFWRKALDKIRKDSEKIEPEWQRRLALMQMAEAYYRIDKNISKEILSEALKEALKLEGKEELRSALFEALILAARLGGGISKDLITILQKSEGIKIDLDKLTYEVASVVIREDISKATDFAEAIAPVGFGEWNVVSLFLRLPVEKSSFLNRVQTKYLKVILSDENFPMDSLIPILGTTFGHKELCKVDRKSGIYSRWLELNLLPKIDENLKRDLLRYLSQRINRILETSQPSIDRELSDREIALFTIGYLLDEIKLYLPEDLDAWEELRERATRGLDEKAIKLIGAALGRVKWKRENSNREKPLVIEPPSRINQSKESKPMDNEDFDSITDACERDLQITKKALNAIVIKDFTLSEKRIEKISNPKAKNLVKQNYLFEHARYLARNGYFKEATAFLENIEDIRLLAYLYVEIIRESDKQKPGHQKDGWLNSLRGLINSLEDPRDKAAFLFEFATLLKNQEDSISSFAEAVWLLNEHSISSKQNGHMLLFTLIACGNDFSKRANTVEFLGKGSLLNSMAILARVGAKRLYPLLEQLEDIPMRIEAISLLAKLDLEREKNAEKL